MTQKLFLLVILFSPVIVFSQTSNHWSRNFNEESSLLSGAVVGGGAGASAIFYNPASISEIEESKLSFNASLFSFEFINAKNAYGEGIDLDDSRSYVIPRFFSYMIKLKKIPNWSLEFAFLNNANYEVSSTNYVDKEIDVLTHVQGNERYTAFNSYYYKLRDDYFGIGGSRKLGENWSLGASMFLSAKSNIYSYLMDIEAGPQVMYDENRPDFAYYSAKYSEQELQKFNDYRLLWKLGLLYRSNNFSFGLNLTTPSVGGIYSDGKKVMRKRSQSNISNVQGEPIPNYLVSDYKEKKDVTVNAKSPMSIAAGLTYFNAEKTKTVYLTVEYFAGLDPYRITKAEESNNIAPGILFEEMAGDEWLTFVEGAKPVFNVALGYRWRIKKDLMLLSGFRTDFSYKKNFDYDPFTAGKTVKLLDVDKYHVTSGLALRVFGHDLITGVQYTFGFEKNQKQLANLSDPVEFNYDENKALQGIRLNTMNTFLNSLSLYFGATINFTQTRKKENEN